MTSITIYNPTGEDVHEASITKDARVFRQLGGDYYVELTLGVDKTLALPKGSYIRVTDPTTEREEKYALKRDASPEPISGVNGYKYVLKFYSRQHDMEACQIKWLAGGSQELSFRVTTSLSGFAELIADNMNAYLGTTDWSFDKELDDTDMREQAFEGVSCWDAINSIANAFGVEWWVDHGDQLTIRFGKCENEKDAKVIREGEIVNRFPAPKRGDDSNYGTRFYIFGGTQNVPESYRSNNTTSGGTTFHIAEKRIQLCKIYGVDDKVSKEYYPYFDAVDVPKGEIVEKTIILNEVFPKIKTTIGEGDILEQDENIIEGEEKQPVYYIKVSKKPTVLSTLGITFTSGALSGRSFGAAYTTQVGGPYIKVLHTTENSGGASLIAVPNANLAPKAGDKYILTGVELEPDRITAAERELWNKGTELALKYANDTNVYDCPVNPVYCSEKKVNLALGDKVILKGAHFGEKGRYSRIQGYEKKLYSPYIATYNIGDNSVYSRTAKVVKDMQLPIAEAVASTERKKNSLTAQISSMQNDTQLASIIQRLNDIEGYDTDTADSVSIPGAKKYAEQKANTARLNAISDIKRDIKQGIQGVTKFSIVAGTQFVGKPHSVDPNPDVKGIYVATNSVFDNVYGITNDDKLQFNYDSFHQNYDLALKIIASDASKYDGAIIDIISDVAAEVLMTQTHLAQGDVIMAVGGSWVKISNTNATSGDGNGQMFGGTIENRAIYVVGEPSTQQLWVIPSEEYRTKHKLSSTVTEFEVTDDDFLASDHKGEYFVVKRAGGIASLFIDGFVWDGVQYDVGDWLVALPYGWKKISGSDVGGSNGVDFEEVKNWVETKLQSYAKMPTEQPLQDSILIYDSDNQTFKGGDVQISTTVQDIENGENSKIPTCGQVAEFVEGAISQIAPGSGGGGGITEETDPVFSVSPAASITEAKMIEWDNKVDKVEGKGLSTNDYTEEDKTQIDSVTKKTDSIENKDISEKDDGIIIEDNDGVEVIKITATTETVHRSEQRWESDDGLKVFAKIDEDGIDGKVSRIIPAITIPIVVEPDSDIVDEGYASPIGRNNVIRANWSAENKYTYHDFIAHYYDIYIGVSDGYSVSKKSLGSDASNSGYELFEYDFCPLNYKKVVMISAGMNTCETGALWGLATFIKAIMTSEEEGFKFLRENVRFKIIPMICPSSFDKDTLAYLNSNGVRINKNFDYCRNWYNITDSTKGEYPDSEVESRILKKWLNDNAWKADLYIDCHQDPDKNVSQEKELTVVICSDSATNSKLRECFPALVQFYRDKGYIAPDISPNTYSWVEVGNNYPKTKYAKDICGIPSLMIEQYCSSTMYGSDGNTINDVAGIKNYVTMLRLYTFAILSGGEKVINCGNISRLTK